MPPPHDLYSLGWTPELSRALGDRPRGQLVPARVAAQQRGRLLLFTADGEVPAEPAGRLRRASSPETFPVVGDWVLARLAPDRGLALVEEVLPRRTVFVRTSRDMTRVGGAPSLQAVAANVDVALIVTAAVGDFNLRRLERYLAAARESGAKPVVVVTKVDLVDDAEPLLEAVERAGLGVPVRPVSNVSGSGIESVRALVAPGRTAALLGSSGVGKSSLVNRLLGEERQAVADVRADGRGRHTTTSRELHLIRGAGLVLDTPGMRTLGLWEAADGLAETFADVETVAARCRFSDCSHTSEPGCAVLEALCGGTLDPERLESYGRLQREQAFLERRIDKRAQAAERQRWRRIERELRRRAKPGR